MKIWLGFVWLIITILFCMLPLLMPKKWYDDHRKDLKNKEKLEEKLKDYFK